MQVPAASLRMQPYPLFLAMPWFGSGRDRGLDRRSGGCFQADKHSKKEITIRQSHPKVAMQTCRPPGGRIGRGILYPSAGLVYVSGFSKSCRLFLTSVGNDLQEGLYFLVNR